MIKTIAIIIIASTMTGTIQIMIRWIGCIPKAMVSSFLKILRMEILMKYVFYKRIYLGLAAGSSRLVRGHLLKPM